MRRFHQYNGINNYIQIYKSHRFMKYFFKNLIAIHVCIITSCMLPLISDTSHWWQTFELYKWILCSCVNSVKKKTHRSPNFLEYNSSPNLTHSHIERERERANISKKWLVWPMTIGQDIKHFLLWWKRWDAIMTYDSKICHKNNIGRPFHLACL